MLISWKNMSFIQTKLKVEKAFLIRSPHVRLVASSKRKRAGGNSSYPWLFQKPYRVWLISSGTHYSHRSKTQAWTPVKMDPALLMTEILFRSLLLLPSSSTAMWTLERSKSRSTVCKKSSGWIFLLKVFMVWQHTVFLLHIVALQSLYLWTVVKKSFYVDAYISIQPCGLVTVILLCCSSITSSDQNCL